MFKWLVVVVVRNLPLVVVQNKEVFVVGDKT